MGMTLKELIDKLQALPPDLPVFISYDWNGFPIIVIEEEVLISGVEPSSPAPH